MGKAYIAVIGKTCAGKETFGKILREEFAGKVNISSHRFSDPLNETLDVLHLPKSRPNQQLLSTKLREAFGEEILGDALHRRAEANNADLLFFDGVRRPQDVVMLRRLPKSIVVYIISSAEVRFERLKKRADRPGDAEKTWDEFLAEQAAESESRIDEIAKLADIRIENPNEEDPQFPNFRSKIRELLQARVNLV